MRGASGKKDLVPKVGKKGIRITVSALKTLLEILWAGKKAIISVESANSNLIGQSNIH